MIIVAHPPGGNWTQSLTWEQTESCEPVKTFGNRHADVLKVFVQKRSGSRHEYPQP